MPVLLALASAAAYGLADFVGGLTSRRTGASWSVGFLALLAGGTTTALVALFDPGSPTATDHAWALVAGLGNGVGTGFLYRGLASGRMGVVAPVSAVGAALVPLVVGLASGERPSSLVWLGVAAALPGIWWVSRPAEDELAADVDTGPAHSASGTLDGVLAGLGFGTLFAGLAQVPDSAGLLPLALNQVVAAVVVAGLAAAVGGDWLPRSRLVAWGAVAGLLGALATGLFLVATHGGYLSVVAVIASLYPAFTVLLAATVLREQIGRGQAVGLALCALAVGLVAAG
ncbi:EamA family transporter [uncultured Nocardioides sp.]|uniref:EamA family transporter n=1 Tax=uncultured Nocardioides sp. TaxID=198441 RepID=UPI002633302C|nr:EamA family transporter [uncultured Nocardioides sp.]